MEMGLFHLLSLHRPYPVDPAHSVVLQNVRKGAGSTETCQTDCRLRGSSPGFPQSGTLAGPSSSAFILLAKVPECLLGAGRSRCGIGSSEHSESVWSGAEDRRGRRRSTQCFLSCFWCPHSRCGIRTLPPQGASKARSQSAVVHLREDTGAMVLFKSFPLEARLNVYATVMDVRSADEAVFPWSPGEC